MKFSVWYATSGREKTVELDSLADLMAFAKDEGHDLILSLFDDEPTLTVYDGYIE